MAQPWYRHPKNRCNRLRYDTFLGSHPIDAGSWRHCGRPPPLRPLADFDDRVPTKSTLDPICAAQTSRVRRVQAPAERDTNGSQGQARLRALADALLFFDPGADRVARYLESTREATQTAAFLGRAKDFVTSRFGGHMRCRIFSTLAPTRAAAIPLLAIWGVAIFDDIGSATMVAAVSDFLDFGAHTRGSDTSACHLGRGHF